MFMIILLFSCFNSHFDPETIKLSKKKKKNLLTIEMKKKVKSHFISLTVFHVNLHYFFRNKISKTVTDTCDLM